MTGPTTVRVPVAVRAPAAVRTDRLRRVAVVVALLGAVALVAGVAWWRQAATDDSLAYAALRDQATLQARQDVVVMNSLDAAHFDSSYQAWLDVTTGVLHDQLAQISSAQRTALTSSGATTTGKVIDGVLTELDDRAGTGRLIASVEETVVAKDGSRTVKRNRFSADIALDGGRWKLGQLQQVAVNGS